MGRDARQGFFSKLPLWGKVLFVLVWPVSVSYGIYWMWRGQKYSQGVRIALSVAAGALFAFAVVTGASDADRPQSSIEPPASPSASPTNVSPSANPPAAVDPAPAEPEPEETLEWKLAVIQHGAGVSKNGSEVEQFRSLLDSIESKTKNSRQECADMSVKTMQLVNEEGVTDDLLFTMQQLDIALVEGDIKWDLAEIAAAYVVLRINE